MGLRVLVCGGRDYTDREFVFETLYALARALRLEGQGGIARIIEGGASGADTFAREWAREIGTGRTTYYVTPAMWREHCKRAGCLRNRRMLVEGKPDLVVAFPGGAGTTMMVKLARDARVPVRAFSGRRSPLEGYAKGYAKAMHTRPPKEARASTYFKRKS